MDNENDKKLVEVRFASRNACCSFQDDPNAFFYNIYLQNDIYCFI